MSKILHCLHNRIAAGYKVSLAHLPLSTLQNRTFICQWYSFLFVAQYTQERARPKALGILITFNYLIWSRIPDLPAGSREPQQQRYCVPLSACSVEPQPLRYCVPLSACSVVPQSLRSCVPLSACSVEPQPLRYCVPLSACSVAPQPLRYCVPLGKSIRKRNGRK
jgi:hypothetical protein